MRATLIVVLVFVLSGCSIFDRRPPQIETNITHPEWPSPVRPQNIDFTEITGQDGKTYIALDYNQSVDLAIYLEDILRYLNKTNNMLCFYRVDLNEKRCSDKID